MKEMCIRDRTGTMTANASVLPANSSYGFGSFNTFISDVLDHDVSVAGNYTMRSTATSKFPMFVSLNPYEVGKTSSADKTFNFQGTLTLHGVSSGSNGGILGFEHQLLAGGGSGTTAVANVNNGTTTSILKNSGTIDLNSGYNMIGIMIDTEYFSNSQNAFFNKRPQTRNDGLIKISSGAYKSVATVSYTHLPKNSNDNDILKLRGYIAYEKSDYEKSYNYLKEVQEEKYDMRLYHTIKNNLIKLNKKETLYSLLNKKYGNYKNERDYVILYCNSLSTVFSEKDSAAKILIRYISEYGDVYKRQGS